MFQGVDESDAHRVQNSLAFLILMRSGVSRVLGGGMRSPRWCRDCVAAMGGSIPPNRVGVLKRDELPEVKTRSPSR